MCFAAKEIGDIDQILGYVRMKLSFVETVLSYSVLCPFRTLQFLLSSSMLHKCDGSEVWENLSRYILPKGSV